MERVETLRYSREHKTGKNIFSATRFPAGLTQRMRKFRDDPLDPAAAPAFVSEHQLQLSNSKDGRRLEFLGHSVAHASRHYPESGVILDQIKCFARGCWFLDYLWFEAGTSTLRKQPITDLGLHALR